MNKSKKQNIQIQQDIADTWSFIESSDLSMPDLDNYYLNYVKNCVGLSVMPTNIARPSIIPALANLNVEYYHDEINIDLESGNYLIILCPAILVDQQLLAVVSENATYNIAFIHNINNNTVTAHMVKLAPTNAIYYRLMSANITCNVDVPYHTSYVDIPFYVLLNDKFKQPLGDIRMTAFLNAFPHQTLDFIEHKQPIPIRYINKLTEYDVMGRYKNYPITIISDKLQDKYKQLCDDLYKHHTEQSVLNKYKTNSTFLSKLMLSLTYGLTNQYIDKTPTAPCLLIQVNAKQSFNIKVERNFELFTIAKKTSGFTVTNSADLHVVHSVINILRICYHLNLEAIIRLYLFPETVNVKVQLQKNRTKILKILKDKSVKLIIGVIAKMWAIERQVKNLKD
jgi:hypothetical protein